MADDQYSITTPWDELVRRIMKLEEEVRQLKQNTMPKKEVPRKDGSVPYSEYLRELMKK